LHDFCLIAEEEVAAYDRIRGAAMGSLLWSFVRCVGLGLALLFLAPFILTLLLCSFVLKKDEAHFSH
jgi:hypothetical protein